MANQIIVSANNTVQVSVTPTPQVQVQISRAAIGNISVNSVANANYANFAGNIVGNLSNLSVTGTTTTGNLVVLGNLQVGNLVANSANYANFAGEAFSVNVANVNGIGNIATVNLDGNASNILDGTGNWVAVPSSPNANYANFAGNVTINAQPNITSVGTLINLTVNSNSTSNINVSNANGFINVTETANLNTRAAIQHFSTPTLNQSSVIAGNVGLSMYIANTDSGNSSPGNIKSYWQFQTNGNLTHIFGGTGNVNAKGLTLGSGNVAAGNVVATANVQGNFVVANYLYGDGGNISNIQGANISGSVANANYANFAGNVTINAQPNITSVGTLTTLNANTTSNIGLTANGGSVVSYSIDNANTGLSSRLDHLNTVTENFSRVTTNRNGVEFFIANTNSGNSSPGNIKGYWRFTNTGNLDHLFGGTGGINAKLANLGTGNLTAGNVNATYLYGDGSNITNLPLTPAAGSNTEIQYNNSGSFGASSAFTFDSGSNILNVNGRINGFTAAFTGESGGAIQTNIDNIVNCPDIAFNRFDNNSYVNNYSVYRARGTFASPTNVQSGDSLFQIYTSAYSNVGYEYAAAGSFAMTVNTNDNAGNITVNTSYNAAVPTGSTFNIGYGDFTTSGNAIIGQYGTGNLQVNGQAYVGSYISLDGFSRSLFLNGDGGGSSNTSSLTVNNGTINVNMDNVPPGYASFAFATYEDANNFINPYTFYRARGNVSNPNNVTTNDTVKAEYYNVYGDSGNTYVPVGAYRVKVISNDGAGNVSSSINIETTNNNDGSEINLSTDIINLYGNVTTPYSIYANSGTIGANLLAGTLTTNAQPNITSVGTLNGLIVSSNTDISLATTGSNIVTAAGVYNWMQVNNTSNNAAATVQQQYTNPVTSQGTYVGAAETGINMSVANLALPFPSSLKGVWRFDNNGNLSHIFGGNGQINSKGANITGNLSVSTNANVGNLNAGNVNSGNVYVAANAVILTNTGNITATQNVTAGNGNVILNTNGTISYLRTFGAFTSNATQTSNGANTTNYMTLNNTEDANGVSIVSSSQITVARTGRYNIQFSTVITHDTNQTANVEIWLTKNGSAVANTNTRLTVVKDQATAAAWNFVDNVATPNTYYQLAWASPDINCELLAIPAANTIANVDIPSVILTVTPVGA